MKRPSSLVIILASMIAVFADGVYGQDRYWVFFRDKPNAIETLSGAEMAAVEKYLLENGILTQRAMNRRSKVLPPSRLVSAADFPVYLPYIDSLRAAGLRIVMTSRWFNAAVVTGSFSQLSRAKEFPFVIAIRGIPVFSVPIGPEVPAAAPARFLKSSAAGQPGDSTFYGPSFTQLNLSGIPEVHALGINGQGVLIGMLDAGFRYEAHDALKHVRVVGEHDFIRGDSITANQPGDTPDQDSHGTSTLSVLGGYAPGDLVGVAYGADFMLAKTELIYPDPGDVDYKSEEDNWVAGMEWMESRGVDVVSSSVAYNIFVDSLTNTVDSAESYFWSRGDFNGKTALCSRAATRAAELGVIVVQAMGNEGNGNGVEGTMDAPADADSIISAGAVDLTGKLGYFSSTGPTSDGHIKPDLVADGVGNYVAVVPGPDTYAYESGTSFATPITAGVAALILTVRPDFTPLQVIDLLKSTAIERVDQTDSTLRSYPNNFYGWGIVNAWDAVKSLGFVSPNDFSVSTSDSVVYLATRAFSTSGVNMQLSRAYYSYDGTVYSSSGIFATDTSDQYAFHIPRPSSLTPEVYFYFNFVDSSGKDLNVPYGGEQAPFEVPGWRLYLQGANEELALFNLYPNPFNTAVHISFALKNSSNVVIEVYDALGRKVNTIFTGVLQSGYQNFVWGGNRPDGEQVASGTYFVRVDVNGSARVLKSLYLK